MLSEFLNSKFLLLSRQTDNMGWGGVIHSFPSVQFCCCCFFCISVAPHPCCLFYCCHSPGHQAHLFSAPPLHTKRPVHITAQRHRRLLKLPTLFTDGDQDPSSCTAFLPSAVGAPPGTDNNLCGHNQNIISEFGSTICLLSPTLGL